MLPNRPIAVICTEMVGRFTAVGITYLNNGLYGIVRPDFIFFVEQHGKIVADIVDPHGLQYSDALPKLQGLAKYAKTHFGSYRRIESVAEAMGKLRVLDLTDEKVQEAIATAKDAVSLFSSVLANDY